MDCDTWFYRVLDDYLSVRIRIETELSFETEEICVASYVVEGSKHGFDIIHDIHMVLDIILRFSHSVLSHAR